MLTWTVTDEGATLDVFAALLPPNRQSESRGVKWHHITTPSMQSAHNCSLGCHPFTQPAYAFCASVRTLLRVCGICACKSSKVFLKNRVPRATRKLAVTRHTMHLKSLYCCINCFPVTVIDQTMTINSMPFSYGFHSIRFRCRQRLLGPNHSFFPILAVRGSWRILIPAERCLVSSFCGTI